jgi:general secretion pathway protein B
LPRNPIDPKIITMSYILEALRKSERERRLGQAPSLPSLLVDQPPSRRRWLPWFVVLLVGLNGAALFYLWSAGWGKRHPPEQIAGADQPRTPTEAGGTGESDHRPGSAAPEKHSSAAIPGSPHNTVATTEVPPAAAAAQLPEKHLEPAATPPAPRESANTTRQAPVKKAVRRPPPAEALEEISKDVDLPEPADPPTDRVALARRESMSPLARWPDTPQDSDVGAEADAQRDPIPLLNKMPADFQRRVPAIKVNVLAYFSVPEERFAIIDMIKYNKGDRLPWGAVLREIRSDGLVLELNGSRFRVPHR